MITCSLCKSGENNVITRVNERYFCSLLRYKTSPCIIILMALYVQFLQLFWSEILLGWVASVRLLLKDQWIKIRKVWASVINLARISTPSHWKGLSFYEYITSCVHCNMFCAWFVSDIFVNIYAFIKWNCKSVTKFWAKVNLLPLQRTFSSV